MTSSWPSATSAPEQPLPTGTALSGNAPGFDTADSQMTSYWNGRLAQTASFTLPNLTLPNTGNLASPPAPRSAARSSRAPFTTS